MSEDAQLLRQFIEEGSEPAFAEIVQRHLGLVYHAAVRQLGDEAHLAADVAQGVFILLAEKSRALAGHPSVAGWLYATTHFKVAELRRSEHRRRLREAAAQDMSALIEDSASRAEWERMRPVIDEALLELGEADREAVLLRFFENRPFAEIGARLRLNEKTAHKRVERALDRLRESLVRRGVTSTAAALATLLSGQAALAVPAGLGVSVTGAAIAASLPSVTTLGTISLMSTKTTVLVSVVTLLLAGGVATHEVRATRAEAAALASAVRVNEQLASQLREERTRAERETVTVRASDVAAGPKPAAAASPVSGPVGPTMEQRLEEGRAFLKANPVFRDAFATKLREDVLMQHAELIAALGLTGERLEQFIAIQMKSRMNIVGQHILPLGEKVLEGGEYTRQLREVLGEAGYKQCIEIERLSPARNLADDLTRSLYFTPTPLTSSQVAQVKDLMIQVISDPANGLRYTGPTGYIPMPVWDALIARARGVLAEPQIDALRDLRQQAKFNHAQTEARKLYDQGASK